MNNFSCILHMRRKIKKAENIPKVAGRRVVISFLTI